MEPIEKMEKGTSQKAFPSTFAKPALSSKLSVKYVQTLRQTSISLR